MTRVSGFKCDRCSKMTEGSNEDYLPSEWYTVVFLNGGVSTGGNLHFCSVAHLHEWTEGRQNLEDLP